MPSALAFADPDGVAEVRDHCPEVSLVSAGARLLSLKQQVANAPRVNRPPDLVPGPWCDGSRAEP